MERQTKDGTFYKQTGPDTWQPVTRQTKDGTIYKKIGVDSWTPVDNQEHGPSVISSVVRKGLQGATGGFSDEIAGGVEALGRVVGLKGINGPLKDVSLEYPTTDSDEIAASYKQGRDRERAALLRDSEYNPKTSIASEIVGGVVSPINKVTKGMSIAKQGAVMGGIYGAGSSDAENLTDVGIDSLKGAGAGLVLGKGFDKVGEFIAPKISQASSKVAEKIRTAMPKKNQQEIIMAADRLGLKVTPAMLDDTGFVERLEYTLSNSPSFLGQRINKSQKQAYETLQNAVKEATKDATGLSDYQVGDKVKSGITAKISERLDPISAVFNEVRESTRHIPISQKSKDAIIRNIQNTDEYILTGGAGKANQYVDMLGRAQNADQVKTMMTMLNSDIQAAQGAERQVLMTIRSKLGNLEENSITRAAIAQAKEAGLKQTTGKKIGSEIVGELRDARQNYRGLMSDLAETALDARLGKTYGSNGFIDKVEGLTNESIQKRFFNTDNQRQLQNLAKNFPEEFELLRQGKLRDILDGSAGQQDKLSVQKFATQLNKLSPEAKEIVFKGNSQLIDDITLLNNSLPRNFNPSGTAPQSRWSKESIVANLTDIPNYLLYKGASSNLGRKIGQNLDDGFMNASRDVTASGVKKLSNPSTKLTGSRVSTQKISNVERFADQGADKLLENSDLTSEEIEQLKSTKKGREFLMETSGYTSPEKLKKQAEKARTGLLNRSED